MNNTASVQPESNFSSRMYKRLTLALFFILPARLSKVFVNLSIIMLVFKVRQETLQDYDLTMKRIGRMLDVLLNDKVLMLPGRTCQWYWPDEVLDKPMKVDGVVCSLRSMMKDNTTFLKHRGLIVNTLIDNLPKSLSFKLKMNDLNNRLLLKHNITHAVLSV